MAQIFFWLDRGDFAGIFQHAWIWAILIVGCANIAGIAAILRHYDVRQRR
jgi:hypothetical protein